ncbi:hypothetical protein Hypma_002253 [Hypsizygus marmoreus]|uniref:Uncharacterized protein n=1 Tax=Hypsizygus marmoreus TaxID=39966 RepID=A0A369K522_HYPMA|nr:hypothetical protein Hypma_002253 [Hypsizygus marmoreus]
MPTHSAHSPVNHGDTMSMLGEGRIWRRFMHSMINAPPCIRVEKQQRLQSRRLWGLRRLSQVSEQGQDCGKAVYCFHIVL